MTKAKEIDDIDFPFNRVFQSEQARILDVLAVGAGLYYQVEDLVRITDLSKERVAKIVDELMKDEIIIYGQDIDTKHFGYRYGDSTRAKALQRYHFATAEDNLAKWQKETQGKKGQ